MVKAWFEQILIVPQKSSSGSMIFYVQCRKCLQKYYLLGLLEKLNVLKYNFLGHDKIGLIPNTIYHAIYD